MNFNHVITSPGLVFVGHDEIVKRKVIRILVKGFCRDMKKTLKLANDRGYFEMTSWQSLLKYQCQSIVFGASL